MEIGLSNVAMKLYEMTTKMIEDGKKDEILPLLNKYYGNKFKKMRITEFLRKYKEQGLNLFSFDVGCFSSITPDIIQKWMDELGVSTSSDAEIPALESVDLTELKENMSDEEYTSYVESLKGKFTKIDRPLMYGSMYMLKLYHVPEAANKVTSDMSDNKYGQPILGGGRYRRTGQKIGEMELNALLARNATEFIQATRESSSKEDSQLFLNNLLGLGLRVVDESGYSLGGSEQKNAMKRLKNKYQGIKLPLKK